MITLADVKVNSRYDYVKSVAPTVAENTANGYFGGQTWLNLANGESHQLIDPDAGTWQQIEQGIDTQITRVLMRSMNRLFRATGSYFYRWRQTSLTSVAVDTQLTRFSLKTLLAYVSVFAEWTVDASENEVTVSAYQAGALSDLKAGDSVAVIDSKRNDGVRTVASVSATGVVFADGTLVDDTDKFVIVLLYPLEEFFQVIGRIIWYDMLVKPERMGLNSEHIGTYSWVTNFRSGSLGYPSDVIADLDQYIGIEVDGTADYVS